MTDNITNDGKIKLIKMAVKEWGNKDLTSSEAMLIISVILSIQKPTSEECTEWAKKVINDHEGGKWGLND